MDISLVLMMVFLSFRNAAKAKEKGASGPAFGFLTFLLFLIGTFIGIVITFFAVFKDVIDPVRLQKDNTAYSQELAQQFAQEIFANPIHSIAIMMCGMGGYLLVNYMIGRIDTKQNKAQ